METLGKRFILKEYLKMSISDRHRNGKVHFTNLTDTGSLQNGKTQLAGRLLHRMGCQPPREGAPTYDFVKISRKLHEICTIWAVGKAPGAPP